MLLATVVLAALAGAARLLWARRRGADPATATEGVRDPKRLMLWWSIALMVGAVAIGVRFLIIIQSPEHISQTYDNIFHLNAVRYVLDSGNASSLSLGGLGRGSGSFYPAVWHAIVSLVTLLSGASIPVAVNAVTIAIGAVFWPCACLFLVRQVVGARPVGILAAEILSAAFAAFPYLMMDFGVLYPYLLAVSVLPAAFALVIGAAGLAREPAVAGLPLWAALLGLLPGLALAHPSAVMALLALSVPIMLLVAYRQFTALQRRRASPLRQVLLVGGWAAAFLVMAVVWLWLPVGAPWGPRSTPLGALGELALNAPLGLPAAWALSAATVIGVVLLVRDPARRWLALVLLMAAFLFFVAQGVPYSYFRNGIVGIWYSDPYRVAALLPTVVLPIAVLGFLWLHDATVRWAGRRKGLALRGAASAVLLTALLAATQLSNVNAETALAAENYSLTAKSDLLTPDETALLERVGEVVPPGVTVAGSPWTGTSLVYALADRPALLPHVGGFETAQTRVITEHLGAANTDPAVCSALRALRVGFVLDFGRHEVHHDRHVLRGLENLASSDAVQLVDEQGAAKLYKITACG